MPRFFGGIAMLVLERKLGQKIIVGKDIVLCIVKVQGKKVTVGIECPRDIPVVREEIRRAAA
jgi:carbon storage regulator